MAASLDPLQQLVKCLPQAAQLWGTDGAVRFTNAEFNRLFGLEPNHDWSASGLRLSTHPGLVDSSRAAEIEKAVSGQSLSLDAVQFKVPNRVNGPQQAGEAIQILNLRLIPILDSAYLVKAVVCLAEPYGMLGGIAEQAMMRTQRMENLETLAASVAHEFNNLFTGIRGLADLIKDEAEPSSDIYEFASSIQSSVMRGADLVARLGSFAQELPHLLRNRSLNEYVEKALSVLQLQATKRVPIAFNKGEDSVVLIDGARMDQALSNLVSNAKDAMSGAGSMCISTGRCFERDAANGTEQEWAYVDIEDSGPGIPAELRQQVTQPFFTTKERGKATGLGLAMTARIIDLHDGRIEIGESASLGGASIRIRLPLANR